LPANMIKVIKIPVDGTMIIFMVLSTARGRA
jgi:hypothetical protein